VVGTATSYDEVAKVLHFKIDGGEAMMYTLDELDKRSVYLVHSSVISKDNGQGQLGLANFARDIGLYAHSARRYEYAEAADPSLTVLLPVALGVIAGVVGVSNLLRWFLNRWQKTTLGVLLGLLLGAVVGLWPFQQAVPPVPGETVIKGRVVTIATLGEIAPEDFPTAFFRPAPSQIAGAAGLILTGAAITLVVARFGRDDPPAAD